MGTSGISPWLPRSRKRREDCASKRQSIVWMLSYFWMSTHSGVLEDHTTPSFSKECLYLLLGWGGRKWRGLSTEAISMACPRLNPEVDVPAVQLVGYWTSQKEIWDLYHEVYLLKRLSGPAALWAQPDERGHQRHPVLPEEPLTKTRGALPCWRRTKGGLPQPLCGPATKWDPTPGPKRETAHMMKPSRRPRRLTGWHWRLPTCWS